VSSDGINPVPVTIITGFLGSGKTTLLNHLLSVPSLKDTAVIVNEFGEVGIDHFLIGEAIENAVLLKNGCVCCTVRGDIVDTLEVLWQQRAAGLIPPFRRIAIETTGLADPGPVAHSIMGNNESTYSCVLDGIVTTVEAVHGFEQLRRQPEARKQVALADRIILTKADLATPDQEAATALAIKALNSGVPVRCVISGRVSPDEIFGLGPTTITPHDIERWLRPDAEASDHSAHHHVDDESEAVFRHDHEIGQVVLRHSAPIPWRALCDWLDSVLSHRGAQVLRIKGLVDIAGHERPLVLQGVHHLIYKPSWLPSWPFEPPQTQLVLIVRSLSEKGLRESFRRALEACRA
jgi:G3E family GTPase